MIRSRGGEIKMENSRVSSSLFGGVFYTAFNPTQPPWWATAGLALLLKGIEIMGIVGVAIVSAGHWQRREKSVSILLKIVLFRSY